MGDAPQLLNTSYTITAEVEIPEGRPLGLGAPQAGDGMIATQGGRFGGWGFYVLKGKPVYVWNLLDLKRERWEGAEALSPGKHTLEFDFRYDGLGFATLAFNNTSGIGRGGDGRAQGRWQGRGQPDHGTHHPAHPAVGRDLRHRRRYRHSRGRQGLSGAVPLQRQAQQGDDQGSAAQPDAGRGSSSAARGPAQQQGQRIGSPCPAAAEHRAPSAMACAPEPNARDMSA